MRMGWPSWLAVFSAILNVLFIVDFAAYAFAGRSLAAIIFEDNSLSDILLRYYPEMSSWEFLTANGILLGFSIFLLSVSIWVAYKDSGIIVDSSSRRSRR